MCKKLTYLISFVLVLGCVTLRARAPQGEA